MKKYFPIFMLLIACFASITSIQAQKAPVDTSQVKEQTTLPATFNELNEYFLALDKTYGKTRRFRYFQENTIYFRMKGEDFIRKATIQDVSPNSITVSGIAVELKDIDAIVRYNNSSILKQAQIYLPLAGIGYFLMDSLNPANTGETGFSPIPSTYAISGSLLATGLFLRVFRKKTYKINNRHLLKTIERSF